MNSFTISRAGVNEYLRARISALGYEIKRRVPLWENSQNIAASLCPGSGRETIDKAAEVIAAIPPSSTFNTMDLDARLSIANVKINLRHVEGELPPNEQYILALRLGDERQFLDDDQPLLTLANLTPKDIEHLSSQSIGDIPLDHFNNLNAAQLKTLCNINLSFFTHKQLLALKKQAEALQRHGDEVDIIIDTLERGLR